MGEPMATTTGRAADARRKETMNATSVPTAPLALKRAVDAAKAMYPDAVVKVRRGRVLAVEDDLIRWIRYENLDRRKAA